MICKNCGAEIGNDQKICPSCGAPQDTPAQPAAFAAGVNPTPINSAPVSPTPVNPTQVNPTQVNPTQVNPTQVNPTQPVPPNGTIPPVMPTNNSLNHSKSFPVHAIFYIIGMISGLISIVMSFSTFDLITGYFESSLTYGGDAYTGIQNAAAAAANNAMYAAECIQRGLGGLLLVLGLALIAFFGAKLFKALKK